MKENVGSLLAGPGEERSWRASTVAVAKAGVDTELWEDLHHFEEAWESWKVK